jgi:hypothetical protein
MTYFWPNTAAIKKKTPGLKKMGLWKIESGSKAVE